MSEELELTALDKLSAMTQMTSYVTSLQKDRDRWKDLAIRAYKEMFSIDQEYSDHKVWIEIEDAYEEATVE
jgi:hypothetical protein